MNKEKIEKLTSMGLVSYHKSLDRKERVQLKNYVSLLFGLSYAVVDGRFCGRMKFTNAELLALKPVIENESWRQ